MVYNHGINGHCTERPADEIDGAGGQVVGCRAQWQWTRRLCAVEGREESRVATKIFENFGGALFKEFIMGRELVSIVRYTWP